MINFIKGLFYKQNSNKLLRLYLIYGISSNEPVLTESSEWSCNDYDKKYFKYYKCNNDKRVITNLLSARLLNNVNNGG